MVFSIMMLDIRSLFQSIDQIGHYFAEYDILCFCETWLKSGLTDDMVNTKGFSVL